MYLMTELFLFSPLIVYAYIRVRKLIPHRGLKHASVLFFVFLFLGYPLAETLSHRETGIWTRYLIIGAYDCLPYLLYLTLSVAAIDLAIVLMRSVKILRSETVSGTVFRSIRLGCYLVIPALIVSAGALNNSRLKIHEYSVILPRKSSAIKELKIAYASDLHLSQITPDNLLERLVDKINALGPDIILIGGDVLEGHGNEHRDRIEAEFRRLRAKYGVYAAPGNHERFSGTSNVFFARAGIQYLEDRAVKIGGAFYLAGRNSGRTSRRMPIGELLQAAPDDLPIILLDHRPTDLENVSRSRVDLQLSGHTHNGQLFPVNLLIMPLQYELAWGMKIKRHTVFIVSSGVQAWGPPVKTAGDSEIVFIKATFQSNIKTPMLSAGGRSYQYPDSPVPKPCSLSQSAHSRVQM
jgi:predicted MPP superfamily phosphohydrolase